MSSSPTFPTLEQLRAAAAFGLALATVSFVAIETAAAIARSSRG